MSNGFYRHHESLMEFTYKSLWCLVGLAPFIWSKKLSILNFLKRRYYIAYLVPVMILPIALDFQIGSMILLITGTVVGTGWGLVPKQNKKELTHHN